MPTYHETSEKRRRQFSKNAMQSWLRPCRTWIRPGTAPPLTRLRGAPCPGTRTAEVFHRGQCHARCGRHPPPEFELRHTSRPQTPGFPDIANTTTGQFSVTFGARSLCRSACLRLRTVRLCRQRHNRDGAAADQCRHRPIRSARGLSIAMSGTRCTEPRDRLGDDDAMAS